jgi:glycosyltransferase involved in cell wall biosynthesis
MGLVYSVIVPIFKVEEYLGRCIDSILNQSFTNFELILVDDGSPDRCPEICEQYARIDDRVRVIHKTNGGLVSARNEGIRTAKGDYICYVDGDDWIHVDLLNTIYDEAIEKHNPDIIIFGIVKLFKEHKEEILNDLSDGIYKKEDLERLVYPYMMYDSRKPFCKGLIFPAACNKIYKRKLLLEHYCKDKEIRMGEDNAFVYECIWYSDKIYICNKVFYYYNRLNQDAMSQIYDSNRFYNNKKLFDYMDIRLSRKSSVLDKQFNAFKAYWLIMAVFHEIKCGKSISEAAIHIRKDIIDNKLLKYVSLAGLPISAKVFVGLLKLRQYKVILLATKLIQSKRGKLPNGLLD